VSLSPIQLLRRMKRRKCVCGHSEFYHQKLCKLTDSCMKCRCLRFTKRRNLMKQHTITNYVCGCVYNNTMREFVHRCFNFWLGRCKETR